MRKLTLFLIGLVAITQLPQQVIAEDDDDTLFTLVLLQMVTQRNDNNAMQSLYPLLLSSLFKDDSRTDDKSMYYLLLGVGNDSSMQQWLPLILNNKKSGTNDKLLMMMFMQQSQIAGDTGMSSLFPLLLLNSDNDKTCTQGAQVCECEEDNSSMLLYIMMMNGSQMNQNNHNMGLYMMFNKNSCDGKIQGTSQSCECDEDDDVEGTDLMMYMMMFMMNPQPMSQNLPASPPQRSIDVKDVLKRQLFAGLGPEYSWMSQVNDVNTKDLARFQLYQQMGIPPNVMSLLSNGGKAASTDERFALIQWMSQSQGGSMNIETMSLMLGIDDAKQFYIHGMIEQGLVDPMTASLLLASMGNISKTKLKELLIMAATGQIDPQTFATIAQPYVPELPEGIFPGQDLYFIHLELLDINTCSLIEPIKRKSCGAQQFGAYITPEQCEVHPYCCYNPYFGEDVIKGEKVPWCYYNIFFVFHDQYKLRVRKADEFKGPQDCPGLFRYGLNLDPFIYYEAATALKKSDFIFGMSDGIGTFANENQNIAKMSKLIHLRNDVGFPGITQFHCRAIFGGCWDDQAGRYPAQYKIPQCYTELKIEGSSDLNLYDPELFKPKVPAKFMAQAGECDTNYFHISTLYYERRACSYTVDMIKYGTEFSPLNEPTREDCLFRLGCCYEDNPEVVAKYQFMPRCYHRTRGEKIELLEDKLFDYQAVVDQFDNNVKFNPIANSFDHTQTVVNDDQGSIICGKNKIMQFIANTVGFNKGFQASTTTAPANCAKSDDNVGNCIWSTRPAAYAFGEEDQTNEYTDDQCLYVLTQYQGQVFDLSRSILRKNDGTNLTPEQGFWSLFSVFSKQAITDKLKDDNIPSELQSLMTDLF